MASRKEQKERLRRERQAREAEAARARARQRTIRYAGGGLLAAAAIAGIAIAIASGGGSGGSSGAKTSGPKVPIPPRKTTNLAAAAKAAGCSLHTFVPGPQDAGHVEGTVHYKQNPPVFGPHNPVPAHDGDYSGQKPPPTEQLVHPLEHGRVDLWYRPTLPARRVGQLRTLFAEPYNGQPSGYKQLLVARPGMPFAVAATTWGQQLGCPTFNDQVFDALRAFRAAFVDKATEQVPYPE